MGATSLVNVGTAARPDADEPVRCGPACSGPAGAALTLTSAAQSPKAPSVMATAARAFSNGILT
jgi:hypothetical protein